MATASSGTNTDRGDLIQAVSFAQQCFDRWREGGLIPDTPHQVIVAKLTQLRASLEAGEPILEDIQLPSADVCWSCKRSVPAAAPDCQECGAPAHTPDTQRLRYLIFVCWEIKKLSRAGTFPLAAADGCLSQANASIAALRRKLDSTRIPMVLPANSAVPSAESITPPPEPAALTVASREAPPPRRNMLEILLDPRSIQWLLASGGVLLVLGLVIWLAAAGIFENKLVVASCMGVANLALLAGGWAVIGYTRHEMAGRALTLLACLLMPLNLWFYDAQGLITLSQGGHLWIPALVCCGLYAVSARLLRDPMFVYVFVAGIAMTGLLLLADKLLDRFWEISAPATLLVVLGLICIHVERAFTEADSPFSRRRFGLAFFWSGHMLLAVGLLLVLGAQIAGDWLYHGLFEQLYLRYDAVQPLIVTQFGDKLLALCLVLAGTYAYVYSDLVVRRIGVYVYVAVVTLLWSEVLVIRLFPQLDRMMEVVIIALSLTGLLANLVLSTPTGKSSPLFRFGPPLGVFLSVLPVVLGVILHLRATATLPANLRYNLGASYLLAMLLTAISCRIGAYLHRHDYPALSTTYFFGTGAATLAGLAGLLLVLSDHRMPWQEQAPLLMLLPLAYLLAARLYRGHSPETPLTRVAHAATAVMLAASVLAAFRQNFVVIEGQRLNLLLAGFFAEAALFYALAAAWRRSEISVYACTVVACAAVWQVLKYYSVADEYHILVFAIVGLLLLVAYRFAVLEKFQRTGLARPAFQGGNALLSLALVGGALLTLSELLTRHGQKGILTSLLFLLVVIGLAAVALVRHKDWRRWYVAMTICNAVLSALVLAILGHLTLPQKLEIVSLVIGSGLLVVGHLGWYREQEQQNDLVSVSLFLGSLLLAVPLTIAVLHCRSSYDQVDMFNTFHTLNELGMLAAGLLLLATGFMFHIKSTTLGGGCTMFLYLLSLVLFIRVPENLKTTAVYIMVGGALFFGAGLLLSLYRDRLLALPDRIKRREGVFRVLTWR
jgi:hypothetical protein